MGQSASKLGVVKKLEENDKLVLLLGEAGAGKSQFLNLICDQALPDVFRRVSTDLTSRSDGYCFVRCKIKDRANQEHNIVVMDTNAIPDNEPELIQCLSQKNLKEKRVKIISVVLLRKFSNNRNTSGYPHFQPIGEICGNRLEARTKTCLVLTHRKGPQDNPERYNDCCRLFQEKFGFDRPVFELQDNSHSAIQILQDILKASGLDIEGLLPN
ncbi:hypothetical protein BJ165DRAFT_623809 [Panaeolus papilionaceus]|nr:hypothetical protein BJ165DRAFT_623809 [Panaeolus papilionaceus]